MADLNNYPKTNVVVGKQYVYDVNTLSWVRMTQPVIEGDTLNVSFPGSMAVTGPLTDAELRAADVKITLDGETVPVTGTFWQATQPVSIAATVATQRVRSGTATVSSVADTSSSTTLLASNANRLGASIQNTSSAVLYIKLGTTASASDFTVRLAQYDYYEVPDGYTGRIDGIWASDPNDGAAKITELT
jgi:hypothetical protein